MTETIDIDFESLLARASASFTLGEIESELGKRGLTLGIDLSGKRSITTLGAWIASGTPGARPQFEDPADHVLAGLSATLVNGKALEIRPAPRRAVGPDLTALLLGANDRFASVERAWLRVHRKDERHVAEPLPALDLDPPVSDAEAELLSRIERELKA
ncbi:hypothetical protein AKJ09_07590 [Labilithrix luteola]|uniref:FAD-binding PCMH-type domain-containing protein n=1 Tax=Labilithrix luteola TaxID=1391654 RepID=A0A0K1Q5J7_9BACT|nr:hypothetical protein AKJ09_07590 [Labilithrix luteola]